LTPGESFGTRYHIIRVLGVGGMGAVYQAWDAELGVAVAIKTIRLAEGTDPRDVEDMERRFKRELVLARQVTHPNVVRIYDLGEIDGTKYITMSFVEGQDLSTILKAEGKLPVARALEIMRQVVSGMQAAHAAGIVHRDLKPANIMIDGTLALIMDFGIARSVTGRADLAPPSASRTTTPRPVVSALTVAGSVMGTLDYMAPEQATAQPVDQRADVYALGLIFYDIILGRSARPRTENAFADFTHRLRQPPTAPRTIDAEVPEAIDAIITKCLQADPAARFQTSDELGAALDALDEQGNPKPIITPVKPRSKWVTAAASIIMLVAAIGAWYLGRQGAAPVETREPLPVLIANFENRTGDAVFDGALEQMLLLGVEGTSFITAYPRQTAQRLATEIAPGSTLDEERARLVAIREGVKVVLAGRIERDGAGYRLSMRAIDPATSEPLATLEERAADKDKVLQAVSNIATDLRRELGDANAENVLLEETFTAGSLDAARNFSLGEGLLQSGRSEDALARFQEAITADPNFGRAYAGVGNATFRLGRIEESDASFKKALGLMERMSERERLRTLGSYYLGPGANYEQAISNFQSLAEKYPADGAGLGNLAVAYFNTLDFKKAEEQGQRASAIYPNNQVTRTNLALYAMYATDFDRATTEAKNVIAKGPRDLAYLPLAIAALDAGKADEAKTAYEDMAKTGARGASSASMGRADLSMYYGRYAEAIAELRVGAAADAEGKQTARQAVKLVALADAAMMSSTPASAVPLIKQALALSKSESVTVPAGRAFAALGLTEQAADLASALEQQVQKRRRAFAGVIRAELALKQKKPIDAIDALTASRQLADVWLVRFTLGRAYLEAGSFAEAIAELQTCLSRRGEAGAVFLDDVPSYRYLPAVYYWLGRAQEGLGVADSAAKNYQAYLALRGNGDRDPLAADARKRSAK
jgi:eukaryotic-like serine/threonine-protein kinase